MSRASPCITCLRARRRPTLFCKCTNKCKLPSLLSTVNPGSNTICRCCTCRRCHTWNTGARNSSDGGKEQDEVTKTLLRLKVNHGSQIPVISFCFETLHLILMMSMTGVNAWMTAVRNNFELIAYWRKLSTSTSHHLCTNFAIDTRGRGRRYRSLYYAPHLSSLCPVLPTPRVIRCIITTLIWMSVS